MTPRVSVAVALTVVLLAGCTATPTPSPTPSPTLTAPPPASSTTTAATPTSPLELLPADGRRLAIADPRGVSVVAGEDEGWEVLWERADDVAGPAFPHGDLVVYQRASGEVAVDGPSGRDVVGASGELQDVASTPQGPALVLLDGTTVVFRHDGADDRALLRLDAEPLAVSYGGGRLAVLVLDEEGTKLVLRDVTGQPLPDPRLGIVAAAALSPDGRRLAAVLAPRDESHLVVVDEFDGLVVRWDGLPALDELDFDGRTIVATSIEGTLVVADLDAGSLELRLHALDPEAHLRWDRADRPFLDAAALSMPEGRSFVRLVAVRPTDDGWELVADPAEWLTGDAAERAATAEGTDAPGGFFIRDPEGSIRLAKLADDVAVELLALVEGNPTPTSATPEDLASLVDAPDPDRWFPTGYFWVEVANGEVVAVAQHYVP